MSDETRGWKHLFDNYGRALALLREAIQSIEGENPSQLEKEGTIRRFNCTTELSWKVMKDYLQSENVVLEQITPRFTIRKAYEAKVISDGQTWMDALDARNKMSHTYDFVEFEKVIGQIQKSYLSVMDELHSFLLEKLVES